MAHDPELVAETRAWLVKASRDLAAAAHELKADPPFSGDAAFHAQQAVEKSLKGFRPGIASRLAKRITSLSWAGTAPNWNPH